MSAALSVAYKDGDFVPYGDLSVDFGTHAFHYGTSVFEGIRAYWNDELEELYIFRLAEHMERMRGSARCYGMALPGSTTELCNVLVELLRRNEVREDVYLRPVLYKGAAAIGLWREGLPDSFVAFAVPMGKYISASGIRCCISSWRRPHGDSAPARAKVGGTYAALALARHEAIQKGFDEALLLSSAGHVAEGSAENVFLVSDGKLITPSLGCDILAGVTRDTVIRLAEAELGLSVVEREVNRAELIFADEVFLCGTAAEITPVIEVDHRPVGDGKIGSLTCTLADLYHAAVHGKQPEHVRWCSPVYGRVEEVRS